MISREQIAHNLRVAREAAGLTQAQVAAAMQLRRPAVTDIENAQRNVTSEELFRLAQLYGRSVSDLLQGSPLDVVSKSLFRRDGFDSSETRIAVQHFVERCRSVRELEGLLGIRRLTLTRPALPSAVPVTPVDALHQGEQLAERERERLGLGTEPIRDPVSLIEDQGVLVGRLDPKSPIDGVYINVAPLGPCVGVNDARDQWTGYRTAFTVLHEYGHWLLDSLEAEPVPREGLTKNLCEVRANAFASAFLMPRPAVHRFFGASGLLTPGGTIIDLTPVAIVRAMHHFGVSRLALLTRLRRLGFISQATWADQELRDFPLAPVAQALGLTLKVKHPLEARFVAMTTQAWAAGLITTGRAADLRGVDVDEFRTQMAEIGAEVEIPADMLMPLAM